MPEYLQQIVETYPAIRYFVVAAPEVAELSIARDCKRLPRQARRPAVRRRLAKWQQHTEEVIRGVQGQDTNTVLKAVRDVPYLRVADSVEESDQILREVADEVSKGRWLVGIAEQLLNPEVVVLWLWPDK